MLLTKLEELSRITSGIWLEKLCPSKVEAFLWKVVHGRVATHVELVNELTIGFGNNGVLCGKCNWCFPKSQNPEQDGDQQQLPKIPHVKHLDSELNVAPDRLSQNLNGHVQSLLFLQHV
ncbi:hypothetical protein V6N12_041553 [Hibiscus sabdariffa]|uniref:Reverse transcriptase zinc-binding domain-containing protein n=1 Tax=Hibiscus sabdariffa TaxID=183260 RepID=A0ABR1ZES4_9ROSI